MFVSCMPIDSQLVYFSMLLHCFLELLRWVYFATCEKGPGACHNDGNKRMHPELWGGGETDRERKREREDNCIVWGEEIIGEGDLICSWVNYPQSSSHLTCAVVPPLHCSVSAVLLWHAVLTWEFTIAYRKMCWVLIFKHKCSIHI